MKNPRYSHTTDFGDFGYVVHVPDPFDDKPLKRNYIYNSIVRAEDKSKEIPRKLSKKYRPKTSIFSNVPYQVIKNSNQRTKEVTKSCIKNQNHLNKDQTAPKKEIPFRIGIPTEGGYTSYPSSSKEIEKRINKTQSSKAIKNQKKRSLLTWTRRIL